MTTPLNPQEIYLLERFTSLEYFGALRDSWGEMISHLDDCLDRFMRDLPSDYRKRARPEQPDVVWGERVLPNFRKTFQGLCDGFIQLAHGDLAALEYSYGPMSDFKGQMDFSSEWMTKDDENKYGDLLNKSVQIAGNIVATVGANWQPGYLTENYSEQTFGILQAPATWPTYQLAKNTSLNNGDEIIKPGIYLPDTPNSCAQFLYRTSGLAPEASVVVEMRDLLNPVTNEKYGERPIFGKFSCVWTLVQRVSESGSLQSRPTLAPLPSHRIRAGEACPETGFYFTPARLDARRKFQQGEIMPDFDSSYGHVIWQWDINQN